MHEPNLQNVPRTFFIPMTFLSSTEDGTNDVIEFNCRNIFKAAPGYVLVSADYCQLEMRILTHYSGDAGLTKIMSSDVDVFKSIAATWSGVTEEEVMLYFDRSCSPYGKLMYNCTSISRSDLIVVGNFSYLQNRPICH